MFKQPPEVRNALNLEIRVQLAEAITRFAADPDIRCLIVTGSDKAFASGADLSEMAEASAADIKARNVQQYWRAISDCGKPLIAAVEGYALGGGLELALCADIIVAGEGARLGLPEVKVGILPGGGGTQRLARLVGAKRALLPLMTGRMFNAAEGFGDGRHQRHGAHGPGAGARRHRARKSPRCRHRRDQADQERGQSRPRRAA